MWLRGHWEGIEEKVGGGWVSLGGDPEVVALDGLVLLVKGDLHRFFSEEIEEEIGGVGDEEDDFRVHPIDLFVELHDLSHSTHWECSVEKSHVKPKQAGRSAWSLAGSEDRGGSAGFEDRVVYPLHLLLRRCQAPGLGERDGQRATA
ncbi:hypothetical protein MRB53_027226 [Persea americana]|uniref:Uncharacterized protein n=1 Tax=Persea americana TaxID=3435 RepID=A0ACC2LKT4_PERAE|nr:hypothetical protein MRB53_027226 [Persea americana]